jgi:hypothetical protein
MNNILWHHEECPHWQWVKALRKPDGAPDCSCVVSDVLDMNTSLARIERGLNQIRREILEPRFEYLVATIDSTSLAGDLDIFAAEGWRFRQAFQAYGEVRCVFERRIRDDGKVSE